MNIELLLERIENLCKEKNITLNTAFIESKVGKNFKANLKTSNPSIGKITMLANYFNVSVEYLKGETNEKKPATNKDSEQDAEFNELFQQLSKEQQAIIISSIKGILSDK